MNHTNPKEWPVHLMPTREQWHEVEERGFMTLAEMHKVFPDCGRAYFETEFHPITHYSFLDYWKVHNRHMNCPTWSNSECRCMVEPL